MAPFQKRPVSACAVTIGRWVGPRDKTAEQVTTERDRPNRFRGAKPNVAPGRIVGGLGSARPGRIRAAAMTGRRAMRRSLFALAASLGVALGPP
jgi:hypothetical protein